MTGYRAPLTCWFYDRWPAGAGCTAMGSRPTYSRLRAMRCAWKRDRCIRLCIAWRRKAGSRPNGVPATTIAGRAFTQSRPLVTANWLPSRNAGANSQTLCRVCCALRDAKAKPFHHKRHEGAQRNRIG